MNIVVPCERRHAYQDGGLPLELQVVVEAQDLPVGSDGHQHLLARGHDQLSGRGINVAGSHGHYVRTCTSAPPALASQMRNILICTSAGDAYTCGIVIDATS